jgi:hypothetical protein
VKGESSELHAVLGMLTRTRLAVDECDGKRTTFISHLGSIRKLVPGPWIAHRDLVYALALANLTPSQRSSLARAVVVEHGREFGVGRLVLSAWPSGLPFGGSLLEMARRGEPPLCVVAWALGPGAAMRPCEFLVLRAQPEWALDRPLAPLRPLGLETLIALGGMVVVAVETAVAARQVAEALGSLPFDAHPRFTPHLEGPKAGAPLLLWPHDALDAPGLRRHEVTALVLVAAPEHVRKAAFRFAIDRPRLELVDVACPGRMDRAAITGHWQGCGRPRLMLRGDPAWLREGAEFFRELGGTVEVQPQATQLGLF